MAEFFMMPAASPTMKIGRLVGWSVKVGDEISFGTVLAEVETDKATAEIESFDDGVIIKILRQGGDEVAVNTPIAIIGESQDEDISALVADFESGKYDVGASSEAEEAQETQEETTSSSSDKIKAGPAARVKADQHGVALSSVQGTGPRGRIMSSDVQNAVVPAGEKGKVVPYSFGANALNEPSSGDSLSFTPSKTTLKEEEKLALKCISRL